MVAAAILLYRDFGTLDFAALAQTTTTELQWNGTPSQWAAGLIVLGALAKSALIPFHSWLPLTLDAPTPVSALMHAGIVNAGGYLMIRMSSFLMQHPQALAVLAIMGGATAGLGALIMMTQSSIKQKLAYSTVAQMGFMMLQCGMGAFTAAMLHIVAHALYKAYAFMNSGNVLVEERQSRAGIDIARVHWRHSILAFALSAALYLGVAFLLRQDLLSKPGGLLLGLFFSYAVSPWLATTLFHRGVVSPWMGVTIASGLQLVYGFLSLWMDSLLVNSVSILPSLHQWVATLLVVVGFSFLQYFQWKIGQPTAPSWLRVWRVHASNHFYIDVAMQRVFGPFFAR